MRQKRHARTETPSRYIRLRDIEAEYGLGYHLIYRLIRAGKLPRLSREVTGMSISVPRAALDQFLADNLTQGQSS